MYTQKKCFNPTYYSSLNHLITYFVQKKNCFNDQNDFTYFLRNIRDNNKLPFKTNSNLNNFLLFQIF